jgi:hypothetical protein
VRASYVREGLESICANYCIQMNISEEHAIREAIKLVEALEKLQDKGVIK